jgi:DNA repair photolyase
MSLPRRVENPPNPYHSAHVEWLDLPPALELTVYEETAKSIISSNESPDISFRHSINPYRGCFHGCAYCYARPSHHYLDLGAGTDFERKIIVKKNAPALLDQALRSKKWPGEPIVFSGNTDCYQPLEANYELTRECLAVCSHHRNSVAIITKGALIRRDIDLLAKLNRKAGVSAHISIAFNDDLIAKAIEPGAPRPSLRFRVIEELSRAGIPVSVSLAPTIPGLNDTDIPAILERAYEAGARGAFMTLLRLPGAVKEVFLSRLAAVVPTRYGKVVNTLKDLRGGKLNNSDFGDRMVGDGPRWDAIRWIFDQTCERLGMNRSERKLPMHRPQPSQIPLFQ